MQFYIAACYLTPLLGGWIADRKLGRYWTIAGTKSAVTAAFHFMVFVVFVGDSFGGVYDQLYQRVSPAAYFALQALIIAAAAVAFRAVAARVHARAPEMVASPA